MPHATDEEGKEDLPTSSSWNIITIWWRKFHFSGRVIACSVLLGLGLILIGGLIFAINITDASDKPNDSDSALPTKAPSNFTGPVVMGIGGFIVITGVIMCLFETQVCRKRTGDASPLISDKTGDPERKGSDPEPGPSTSHGHKSRKHGAQKTGTSPRKSKSRHVKSRSKERNQKTPSPGSPSVPIQTPKSYITSSEDNFLTPPNTLDENATAVKERESKNSEIKHSSLMKSFTSSDPSWNQSTEFLTPSASFRDTSVSLNSSVEIDKNNDLKRLPSTEMSDKENISSEFMTPLTVEEDRIQQLLIRVKNEQKQMAESKKTNVGTSELSGPQENSDLSQTQMEIGKNGNEVGENTVKENGSTDVLLPESNSAMEDLVPNKAVGESSDEVADEKNASQSGLTSLKESKDTTLLPESNKGATDQVADEKNASQSSLTSLKESKDTTLLPESNKGASDRVVPGSEDDLDSSVSSDETVVSPDSFQENTTNTLSSNESSTVETLKENSDSESKCPSSISESSDTNKSPVSIDVDHSNNHEKNPQQDVAEVNDLSKNDDVKIEVHGIENESKDKAS